MADQLLDDREKLHFTHTSEYSMDHDPSKVAEKSFDQVFIPITYQDRTPMILARDARDYVRDHCVPSKHCSQSYIKIFFPCWSWLKIYQMSWLPNDIICGITVLMSFIQLVT